MAQAKPQIQIEKQRSFWNSWNAAHRSPNSELPQVNRRQAEMVRHWISRLGRRNLDILEIGCGSGWLSEQLVEFGNVTGTDLADEVLPRPGTGPAKPLFIAGDFFQLDLPLSGFDVVVSLETLAHVQDQPAFLAKIATLMRPTGHLMLATQNKFVLERWSRVAPVGAGQVRKWVNARTLRRLVSEHLEIAELTSIFPVGDRGVLRWINSYKLNRAVAAIASRGRIDRFKERLFLGHTLMVRACKAAKRG